jgi:signal transduction histidine kinase
MRSVSEAHRDWALALALAAAMAIEITTSGDPSLLEVVSATSLVCVPLAVRRAFPSVTYVMVIAGSLVLQQVAPRFVDDSFAFLATFVLAGYSLGRYAVRREALIGALLITISIVHFFLTNGEFDAGAVMFSTFVAGGPWAAGLAIRLRQARVHELALENARLTAEQEELTRRAVAEERANIARELHDVISHAISVTVLQARGARRTLGPGELQARQALDAIERVNTGALSDMRRLLGFLRDTDHADAAEHSPQPSLARLDHLLDEVRRSGLDVSVELTGKGHRDVPPGIDLSAYRIVQEALTNVLKHAGNAAALVRIDYGSDALSLEVEDDGEPQATRGSGQGLVGIRERVAVVGGRVTAGPRPEGGYAVRARLPYSLELT